jgi:hypothetical protein
MVIEPHISHFGAYQWLMIVQSIKWIFPKKVWIGDPTFNYDEVMAARNNKA